MILGTKGSKDAIAAAGKRSKEAFLAALPAFGSLVKAVIDTVFGNPRKGIKGKGHLTGLDGGKIPVRHKHAALNTLLQSAGAIIMKQVLVTADEDLQAAGFIPGETYEWVCNVHDEVGADVLPERVEEFVSILTSAFEKGGKALNFACPIVGQAQVGKSWAETH